MLQNRIRTLSTVVFFSLLASSHLAQAITPGRQPEIPPTVRDGMKPDGCDSVLIFTGRETRLFISSKQIERYQSYREDKYSGVGLEATVPVKSIPVNFKGEYEDSKGITSEERERFDERLFSYADTVFEPAVKAWIACKTAAKLNVLLDLKKHSEAGLVADISLTIKESATTLEQIVFDRSILNCTVNDKGFKQGAKWPLASGKVLTVACERKALKETSTEIRFRVAGQTHIYILPEKAGPPRKLDLVNLSNNVQQDMRSCNAIVPIEPKPYDRELLLKGPMKVRLCGDGSDGGGDAELRLNGQFWAGGEVNREGSGRCGDSKQKYSTSDIKTIKAFEPGVIQTWGASRGIGCATIEADILIAK
jgi:hypothetical protein